MNFLGLNSPEIFLISVIVLSILGPKRIEKGWLLFQRLLKFLLSKESAIVESSLEEPKVKEVKEEEVESSLEEPKVNEVKEEEVDSSLDGPNVSEGKEEILVSKSNEEKPKVKKIKKVNEKI